MAANQKAKMKVTRASVHQGQAVFSADSRGRQCVAIAAAGACFASLKPIDSWNSSDLDQVLWSGDSLYLEISRKQPTNEHGLLMIADIPERFSVFGSDFSVDHSATTYGIWRAGAVNQSMGMMKLQVVQLFERAPAAILVWKDSATLLHKTSSPGTFCCVFDSHARNDRGLPSPRGKAILLQFSNADELACYLSTFVAQYAQPVPYEIGSLSAHHVDD